MICKDILLTQPMMDSTVIRYINALVSGDMSLQSFHNKKRYCKTKRDLVGILQLTIAYEVYKGGYL